MFGSERRVMNGIFFGQAERQMTARRLARGLALAGMLTAAMVLAGCQKSASGDAAAGLSGPVHEGPLRPFARGSMAKLTTWARPKPAPLTGFKDRDGKPVDLSRFRGKVVLVNVWATWCAPCRIEMPTLAALQRRYAASDLMIVPVSVDRAKDVPDARSFIDVNDPLPLFSDTAFALPSSLKLRGMPSTIIYDRQGREVARLEGEADWNTADTYALIDALLKRN